MAIGKMPAAGDVAPEFELPDSTGAPRGYRNWFCRAACAALLTRPLVTLLPPSVGGSPRPPRRNPRCRGAAVSADPPAKSEALRRELRLPFPILCDTERRVAGLPKSRALAAITYPKTVWPGDERCAARVRFFLACLLLIGHITMPIAQKHATHISSVARR